MDLSFSIIELALMILLFIIAGVSVKRASNKWRLLYAAPTFVAISLAVFGGFDKFHAGLYIAAALQMICLFLETNQVKQKRIVAVISGVMIAMNIVFISISSSYHRIAYYRDFEKAFSTMKEHYVLADEKGIDWDKLYEEYNPVFREVDKSQSNVENYKAWARFTGEFYDGHVGYAGSSEGLARDAICRAYGNDYGLSIGRLSTGEYVAINVEGYDNSYSINSTDEDDIGFYSVKEYYKPGTAESDRLILKNAGIKNGTVITKWNGMPLEECLDEVNYYMEQYPVRENEEFYKPIYAAGIGNDMNYGDTYVPDEELKNKSGELISSNPSVDITFIDEDGNEKVVTAPNLGIYAPRMYDTMQKIDKGVKITNLEWQEVNENTYMIRISQMAYDQETYEGSDFTEVSDKLRGEVLALKEAGVKNIIFDLRSNGGGNPYFVEAVAQIFAPEGEHLTYYNAVINEDNATYERDENGKYKMGVPSTYVGEDLWHDGKIILLVNAMCVSAGDDMTYIMGNFPNVKVMGLTSSNSSCQAVTGVTMEAGQIQFSAVPNLLPDGEVAIDTRTDHVGRTPFDEKIPFDQNVISAIFDKGEDYLLDYVAGEFSK